MTDVIEKTDAQQVDVVQPAPQLPAVAQAPGKLSASTPFLRTGSRAMLVPRDLGEAMEFAKLMCKAEGMVSPHLIGNPGACLGVVMQALDWGLSPYAVAQKCFLAKKPDKEGPLPVLAYEAQLLHAVVEKNAPLKRRLRHEFIGEGAKRQCKVWGTFNGEDEPHVYTSPETGKITPKNSPLWTSDPDRQLHYYSTRAWARMFCPDVLMGAYSNDELLDAFTIETPVRQIDPFAGPGPKLPANGGGGVPGLPAAAPTVPDAARPNSPQQSSENSEAEDAPAAPASTSSSESDASSSASVADEVADSSSGPAGASGGLDAPAIKTSADAARALGKKASAAGKSEDANPYDANSDEWLAWITGFHGDAQ